jgi:hypothetical protein
MVTQVLQQGRWVVSRCCGSLSRVAGGAASCKQQNGQQRLHDSRNKLQDSVF